MLAIDPEPGESADRGLTPDFVFTDRLSDDNGEPALEPSELDDFDLVLFVEDNAVRAATLASSCINRRLCSALIAGNDRPEAAAAAAARSLPIVTKALPYSWARTKSTASKELLGRLMGPDKEETLEVPFPLVELDTFDMEVMEETEAGDGEEEASGGESCFEDTSKWLCGDSRWREAMRSNTSLLPVSLSSFILWC